MTKAVGNVKGDSRGGGLCVGRGNRNQLLVTPWSYPAEGLHPYWRDGATDKRRDRLGTDRVVRRQGSTGTGQIGRYLSSSRGSTTYEWVDGAAPVDTADRTTSTQSPLWCLDNMSLYLHELCALNFCQHLRLQYNTEKWY